MKWIDGLLNRITMYRLLLYTLAVYILVAIIFGFTGQLPINGLGLAAGTFFLLFGCWLGNFVFAKVFGAPVHNDSAYLTALILALIINPVKHPADFILLFWVAGLSMASKYILAIRGQHIFNPAALAVALTALTLHQSATWWIGNAAMLPFVLIGGFLIIRKLKKFTLVGVFLIPAVLISVVAGLLKHTSVVTIVHQVLIASPLFFFASIMLTEPVTMPGTKGWRLLYAMLIGTLFAPQVHLGSFYFSPELALLTGNAVSFILRPRARYVLRFQKKVPVAEGVYDFVFVPDRPLRFYPGQYVELTVPHHHNDGRGLRRYFTIASMPGEPTIRFGIKFYQQPSTFKQALFNLRSGDVVTASQLGGDFTLPADPAVPLVFIAGGIGVTPYRSMVATLLAVGQARSITLLYSAQNAREIAYDNIFEQAAAKLGLKTVYTLTDPNATPPEWTGGRGFITPQVIQSEVPDYHGRVFYLSGPPSMVNHFRAVLQTMGLPPHRIKTDFFPGFA